MRRTTKSWVPLGADYSRHSRTGRDAFLGGFLGYGITQVACLLLGLFTSISDFAIYQVVDLFTSWVS